MLHDCSGSPQLSFISVTTRPAKPWDFSDGSRFRNAHGGHQDSAGSKPLQGRCSSFPTFLVILGFTNGVEEGCARKMSIEGGGRGEEERMEGQGRGGQVRGLSRIGAAVGGRRGRKDGWPGKGREKARCRGLSRIVFTAISDGPTMWGVNCHVNNMAHAANGQKFYFSVGFSRRSILFLLLVYSRFLVVLLPQCIFPFASYSSKSKMFFVTWP